VDPHDFVVRTQHKAFPLCRNIKGGFYTNLSSSNVHRIYVPLVKAVGIKFPPYDQTPSEDSTPTFIQTELGK